MSSPARGTPWSIQSLSPALVVSFSFNPFTNVCRTVFQLNSVGFATRQKLYGVTIQERYVFQVQGELAIVAFQIEQSLQLPNILGLDSAAERKDNFAVRRSLDFQHDYSPSLYLLRSESNSDTKVKPLKNKELGDPAGSRVANSRFFRETKTDLTAVICRTSGRFETELVNLERANL